MKTQDPHSDLQDGFEASAMPPIGPDGAPQIPPQRASPPARPSLCSAGPCRNYHRLVTQVDAENPRAVRLPIVLPEGTPGAQQTDGGTVYRAPPVFHVETHHYCYPSPGIEMPLGALPVVECTRWEPVTLPGEVYVHREDLCRVFWESRAGRRFRAEVSAWEAARAQEQARAAEAEALIAQSMAAVPNQIRCQFCGREFDQAELDVSMSCAGCRASNPETSRQRRSDRPTPTR